MESSSARVRASLESIWATLVDDDFFIGLNDGISHVVDTVKILIDSMGGVKGVVAGLGLVLTTVFKNNITDGINNALHNFRNFYISAIYNAPLMIDAFYDKWVKEDKERGAI